MPPAKVDPKRKRPAFNPPKPTNPTTITSSTGSSSKATNTAPRRSKATTGVRSPTHTIKPARGGFKSARTGSKAAYRSPTPPDDEDRDDDGMDIEEHREHSDDDFLEEVTPPQPQIRRSINSMHKSQPQDQSAPAIDEDNDNEDSPAIPRPLLVKIMARHWDNEGTRIQKGALKVLGRYMDVFVREAVARAVLERDENGSGGGGDFLEVSAHVHWLHGQGDHRKVRLGNEGLRLMNLCSRSKIWRSWRRSCCSTSERLY